MSLHRIKQVLLALTAYFFLSSFVLINTSRAGDGTWTSLGLYGAVVEALAVDPHNSAVIYAGANGVGIFKSVDGGTTWTKSSSGIPQASNFSDIAVDHNNSSMIYAATNQGPLYKSIDGGVNWNAINSLETFSVAVSPIESNVLLLGGWNGGIFRSIDGGDAWQPTTGSSQAWLSARVIVFAPGAPHIVYAAGFDGVQKSMDGGISWTAINNGFVLPPQVWSLTVDPFDNQVVYIGTANDGIYKTTNGGASWTPIGTGLESSHITAITINPANQQNMYVGGGINPGTGLPGVYTSLDNQGLSWQPMMDGMGSRAITRLIIDNSALRNLYAGTHSGVWKFTLPSTVEDFSISINNGALFTNQTAVTLHLTAPIGTSEVMISNDGGFTGAEWVPFANQLPWTITSYADNTIPRTVYAKFKTNGRISGLYQDDIVLDTTAPSGSVEIIDQPGYKNVAVMSNPSPSVIPGNSLSNDIFLPLAINNVRPGYSLVNLLLSAADNLSGVNEMLISYQSDFTDTVWQPYGSTTSLWVPVNQPVKVFVMFRDRAGNLSPVYSDTVELH